MHEHYQSTNNFKVIYWKNLTFILHFFHMVKTGSSMGILLHTEWTGYLDVNQRPLNTSNNLFLCIIQTRYVRGTNGAFMVKQVEWMMYQIEATWRHFTVFFTQIRLYHSLQNDQTSWNFLLLRPMYVFFFTTKFALIIFFSVYLFIFFFDCDPPIGEWIVNGIHHWGEYLMRDRTWRWAWLKQVPCTVNCINCWSTVKEAVIKIVTADKTSTLWKWQKWILRKYIFW